MREYQEVGASAYGAQECNQRQQAKNPVDPSFFTGTTRYPSPGPTISMVDVTPAENVVTIRERAQAVVDAYRVLEPKFYAAQRVLGILDRNSDVEDLITLIDQHRF